MKEKRKIYTIDDLHEMAIKQNWLIDNSMSGETLAVIHATKKDIDDVYDIFYKMKTRKKTVRRYNVEKVIDRVHERALVENEVMDRSIERGKSAIDDEIRKMIYSKTPPPAGIPVPKEGD